MDGGDSRSEIRPLGAAEEEGTRPVPEPVDEEGARPVPEPVDEEGARPVPEPVDEEGTRPVPEPVDEDPTLVLAVDEDPTVVFRAEGGDASAPAPLAEAGTAIAPSASPPPMLLERIEPSLGRGEWLRLDAAQGQVHIGRAEHNDLRLYTASASREHAVIARSTEGSWILTPTEGKSVAVDGYPTEEQVELEVGMNLVFGGDHLRCVADAPVHEARAAAVGRGATERADRGGRASWIAIGVIAAIGASLIAYAWLTG